MNFKDFTLKLEYKLDGKDYCTTHNDENVSFDVSFIDNDQLKIVLNAKKPITVNLAEIYYDHFYASNEKFFGNGYQSWTYSTEYKYGDRQHGLKGLCKLPGIKKYAGVVGDYSFVEYGKDLFHSHGYTYLRKDKECTFFGSLNERTGYTIFYADYAQNVFAIVKDLEGIKIQGNYEMLNIFYCKGTYNEVFDNYFKKFPEKNTNRVDHLSGYTSWYNYYQNINEEIILRDLNGLKNVGNAANIFQIDDGYEKMIGDWEYSEEKFPNGLKPIVNNIHKQNLLAGLWVAPFAAQFGAEIVEKHPDWLIVKKSGSKLFGGVAWGGFYVLDIEKEEVRIHIKKVFDRIFNDWGFDMVKLDFLYAACIIPRNNKTRGQLMCEAMDFLRECCDDKIILGCGVPLVPAFGRCDACRISSDMEFSFKDRFYTSTTNQEIISTRSAMTNSAFRRHLNGRIWANDPDVFFLRSDGMHEAKYSWNQKKLLAKVNNMFGDVLFVSDNVGAYGDMQLDLLIKTYKKFEGKVIAVDNIDENVIMVIYEDSDGTHRFEYNIISGKNEDKIIEALKW